MNQRLKFAIVGCGKIAQRHAVEASRLGDLIAVCDTFQSKANLLAAQYNARPYYSLQSLLAAEKSLDIVCICTPNGLHATQSILALNAGLNVLCEKPMAISSADAKAMINAAEKNDKKLHVVKQNRYNPPVVFLKELLREEKLGKLMGFELNCFWNRPAEYYDSSWRGTKALDGGILYTQFSHFIDILYWFLGDISQVNGYRVNSMHNDCVEFEDMGVATLQMANHAIGTLNYSINSFAKNMEGSLTIFGNNGTVKIGGQYLNELDYFSVADQTLPSLVKGNPANQYGIYQGSMSNHDKVYEAFTNAILDPDYPLVSAYDTMKTVEIIERIYQASPFLS